MNHALTWADVADLASECSIPVFVKGLVTAEDAELALDHGAAGVVVSNHGGRQLDRSLATADALPEIAEAVDGRGRRPGRRRHPPRHRRRHRARPRRRRGARRPARPLGPRRGRQGGRRPRPRAAARGARADPRPLRLHLAGRADPRPRAESTARVRIFGLSDRFSSLIDGPADPQRRIAEPRPRRRSAVLRRLRQRRLLDLLRARRHRRLRPRADPGRLRHLRPDLRRHRRHLRRGDGDVPRGRRLLQLRPPRLQRAGQLHRRLGADAQLHDHGRDLGLLRAPLPGRLLALAGGQPRGHHRRRGADRRPGADQHPRHRGVGETEPRSSPSPTSRPR